GTRGACGSRRCCPEKRPLAPPSGAEIHTPAHTPQATNRRSSRVWLAWACRGPLRGSWLSSLPEVDGYLNQHPHRPAVHARRAKQSLENVVRCRLVEAWVGALQHLDGVRFGST